MLTGTARVLLAVAVGWLGSAGDLARVERHFQITKRVSFVLDGAHSDMELSADDRALYFVENGSDGMVLKRVSLEDGRIDVVVHFGSAFVGSVYPIPGHGERVILAKQFGDAKSERSLSFVSVDTGKERPIEMGSLGTDGRVAVSPSGRFFGVGTGYQCESEGRFCHATPYGLFDGSSGREVFSYSLPTDHESLEKENSMTSRRSEERAGTLVARTVQKANWVSDDVLVLGTSGSQPVFAWAVLSHEADGGWRRVNGTEAVMPERRQTLYPADREVVLRHGGGVFRFRAGDFPGQALINAGDRVVVLKENRVDATKDRVDVSVLSWKEPQ